MNDWLGQIRKLDAEVYRLNRIIAAMKRELFEPPMARVEWGLTRREARAFEVLMRRPLASKEALVMAMYANDDLQPDPTTVESHVCNLRKKLRPWGIQINSARGVGYWMDEKVKELARQGGRLGQPLPAPDPKPSVMASVANCTPRGRLSGSADDMLVLRDKGVSLAEIADQFDTTPNTVAYYACIARRRRRLLRHQEEAA